MWKRWKSRLPAAYALTPPRSFVMCLGVIPRLLSACLPIRSSSEKHIDDLACATALVRAYGAHNSIDDGLAVAFAAVVCAVNRKSFFCHATGNEIDNKKPMRLTIVSSRMKSYVRSCSRRLGVSFTDDVCTNVSTKIVELSKNYRELLRACNSVLLRDPIPPVLHRVELELLMFILCSDCYDWVKEQVCDCFAFASVN